jgi:hypothetical protein
MSELIPRRAVLITGVAAGALAAGALRAEEDDLPSTLRTLLARYAAKDLDGLMELLDPDGCVMIGTDIGEHAVDLPGVRAIVEGDYALWDSSEFGPIDWIHVDSDGQVASVMFQTKWLRHSAGVDMAFTIRFATAWRRRGRDWKLTQSLNQVASIGTNAKPGETC